ncbi:tyrosine-type recombinase/integrase [Arthrobacter ramosus]|nr:tyrosine-type recombinase/integrase [Arthrobacter ramosus]
MDSGLNVVVSGPLGGFGVGFAEYLGRLGYAPTSIGLRLNLMRHLSRWLVEEAVSPAACDAAALERFLVGRRVTHTDMSSAGSLAPLVAYLRSIEVIPGEEPETVPEPGPVDLVLERWGRFLADDRGLRTSTIRYYRELARPFLLSRLGGQALDLEGLDARAVSGFVMSQIPGMPVGSAKLTVTALRSLLRFLFAAGHIGDRLDQVVPARAGYRDSGLPRGLTPERVKALIAAVDPASRTGKRDLAIVLVLARLGLRAGEVAALSLDDVDWRAGTLRVPGKGGQSDLLPLAADVGAGLAAHLSVERHPAATGRALFFTSSAPYRRLSSAAVKAVVRCAGARAGLGPVGAHRLRHAAGTATINAGASLEEVAQLLRHRHLASTTIYAKVDLTRLAGLARPWPGLGAGQAGGELR